MKGREPLNSGSVEPFEQHPCRGGVGPLRGREGLAYGWRVLTRAGLELALRLGRLRTGRPAGEGCPGRILYVAASVLPYHISGYTTRTQAVARAMSQAGMEVSLVTRPGYPWDRPDRLAEPDGPQTTVDGVVYDHIRRPTKQRPVLAFALQGAAPIAAAAEAAGAGIIQAASNHVNALPALLAARKLGRPFQYEMRGLWELSRVSRQPDYARTQAFRQGLELEGFVARQADRIFVISDQLAQFAQRCWDIPAERFFLLPNCASPELRPADPAEVEPDTIGYAGSLIGYEGLDTLIGAVAELRARGRMVTVRLAGEGEAREALESQAGELGLSGQIRFLGRMPLAEAQDLIRRSALVCLPRRPFQVCSLVPPIKLVEALALGKPVIVPDLPVFRDELGDSGGGWFFSSGEADSLAEAIDSALGHPAALAAAGRRARLYAVEHRNWSQFVTQLSRPCHQEG